MIEAGPERVVFVGGAPRSGTTVVHALICSAAGVSHYHPEISFFRGLAMAYRNGKLAWDQHTSAFFQDREAFRAHMREHVDLALGPVWRATGGAPILACKDPLLTPYFPDLGELPLANARFVVVVRDPLDVVRSRQEVHEKANDPGRPFSSAHVESLANDYLATYRAILSTDFSGRLLMFRYEDLNTEKVRDALRAFLGVAGFDTSRMWGQSAPPGEDPWGSPKYNGPIDLEARLEPLAPEFATIVRRICAPIMQRFHYE